MVARRLEVGALVRTRSERSSVPISGVVGQVRWGYYTAAGINGYTVWRDKARRWQLKATVVLSDAFKMAQRPLLFVAPTAKGEWRWPIESFEIRNGAMTAQLGAPQERKDGHV